MIKKLILIIFTLALSFSLTACTNGHKTVTYAPGPNLKVCVTIPSLYVMTADLINTRKNISLEQIVPYGSDISSFDISDSQIKHFSSFDICIINGLGLDEKIADKLSQANPKIIILNASEGIDPILKDNGEPNPYLWQSPVYSALQMKNIAKLITEKDVVSLSEKEQEKVEKEKENKNAPIQKTAKEEVRNRATLYGTSVFTAYNEAIKSSGLSPLKTDALDLFKLNELLIKEVSVSIDTKNIRTTGTLRPIVSEDYYFDYLARDFGLEVSERIYKDSMNESLEKLSKSGDTRVIFITSGTKSENESLYNKYSNLKFCFLERINDTKLLPNTLEANFINNFNSMRRTYASISSK